MGTIASERSGRCGSETWSITTCMLAKEKCVALVNLSPEQLDALARFEGFLKSWGFVLQVAGQLLLVSCHVTFIIDMHASTSA